MAPLAQVTFQDQNTKNKYYMHMFSISGWNTSRCLALLSKVFPFPWKPTTHDGVAMETTRWTEHQAQLGLLSQWANYKVNDIC